MPTVKVFSAGDHFHAEPVESGELIKLLLERAGYTKAIEWECRIDKMKHCSANSPPVRVISHKPYGVSLRVKPYTHGNVDHLVTLMVPEGTHYSASDICRQLKGVEKSISRQWRQKERVKGVMIPKIPTELIEKDLPEVSENGNAEAKPEVAQENRPNFKNLKGIAENSKKLKYVLERIHKISELGIFKTKQDFTDALVFECGWGKEEGQKQIRKAASHVLINLIKHEYIMPVLGNRDKIIGYCLDDMGKEVLGKEIIAKPTKTKATEPKIDTIDFVELISNARDKFQELANVGARLTHNKRRKEELLKEVHRIDEENKELTKVLQQTNESFNYLSKLEKMITPLPSSVSNSLDALERHHNEPETNQQD